MRSILWLFLYLLPVAVAAAGCHKQVEAAQEDLLVKLIADGQWTVAKYKKGTIDITAGFSLYRFQFKTNYTVDALNSGTVEATGTWSGNIATRTIVSDFPEPNSKLIRLNGTWLVTDSGYDFVEARQTITGDTCSLRLEKD